MKVMYLDIRKSQTPRKAETTPLCDGSLHTVEATLRQLRRSLLSLAAPAVAISMMHQPGALTRESL